MPACHIFNKLSSNYFEQIIGLNPPFGMKAMLANRFIEKALSFKPKLIILIVPKEAER
jgi:hypothetical protein